MSYEAQNPLESNTSQFKPELNNSLAGDLWSSFEDTGTNSNKSNSDVTANDFEDVSALYGLPSVFFVDSTKSPKGPVKAEKPANRSDKAPVEAKKPNRNKKAPVEAQKPKGKRAQVDTEKEPNGDGLAVAVKQAPEKPDPKAAEFGPYDYSKLLPDLLEVLKNEFPEISNRLDEYINPDDKAGVKNSDDSADTERKNEIKAQLKEFGVDVEKNPVLKKALDNYLKNLKNPGRVEQATDSYIKFHRSIQEFVESGGTNKDTLNKAINQFYKDGLKTRPMVNPSTLRQAEERKKARLEATQSGV